MKVLFVTRGFPSEGDPMSGNYEAVQAKAIAVRGHDVSVIAIKWKSPRFFFKQNKLNHRIVDGVHVFECVRVRRVLPKVRLFSFEQWFMRRTIMSVFKQYLKEYGRPDIIHAHILSVAAIAIVIKRVYHLPFVITEHWTEMNKENISPRLLSQSSVYHEADQVICVSEALSENLKAKLNVNSIVINNMVSNLFFMSKKQERNDGLFRLVTVGALRMNKRFDLLIESFAHAHFPSNVKLEIIGGGEERARLERKIAQYGLEGQVTLAGVKTPEEVSYALCQSDCYVLSSRLETFAIVVIEALAKGLPVIATRCGGPETFVRPEDGILVEKENVQELSEAMKYMAKHYKEYDSGKIRRHCYDNYSQDMIADKIIGVYKDVFFKLQ